MTVRRWDKSKMPQGPWTLNKDAPQAQGLAAWYPMSQAGGLYLPDRVGNAHFGALGTAPTSNTLDNNGAPAVNFISASSQFLEASTSTFAALPLSIALWAKVTGTSGVMACVGTNGANTRCQIQIQGGRTIAAAVSDSAGVAANSDTLVAAVDGDWSHCAAVFASNTSRQSWINGGGSAGVNSTNLTTSGMDRLLFGGRRNSGGVGAFINFPLGETGIWTVALGADIVARLADPGLRFELWYPLRSKKWIAGGSGSNTQVNPGVGALTLSGFAATVAQSANQSLTPGVGVLSLSGLAPSISQPIAAAPGVGALTLSGPVPTVTQASGQFINPDTGALSLSGPVPTIAQSANNLVLPGVGALTLSGPVPSVAQSASQSLVPGTGTLTLQGYAPLVQQSGAPGAGSQTRLLMGVGV